MLTTKQLNRTLRTHSLDSVGGSQLLENAPRVQVISGHCARHRHMMPWLCENCGDSPQDETRQKSTKVVAKKSRKGLRSASTGLKCQNRCSLFLFASTESECSWVRDVEVEITPPDVPPSSPRIGR
jgi:hypothetical protein